MTYCNYVQYSPPPPYIRQPFVATCKKRKWSWSKKQQMHVHCDGRAECTLGLLTIIMCSISSLTCTWIVWCNWPLLWLKKIIVNWGNLPFHSLNSWSQYAHFFTIPTFAKSLAMTAGSNADEWALLIGIVLLHGRELVNNLSNLSDKKLWVAACMYVMYVCKPALLVGTWY